MYSQADRQRPLVDVNTRPLDDWLHSGSGPRVVYPPCLARTAWTISLPKGGGAIRGMGEKFGANPVTGMTWVDKLVVDGPSRKATRSVIRSTIGLVACLTTVGVSVGRRNL